MSHTQCDRSAGDINTHHSGTDTDRDTDTDTDTGALLYCDMYVYVHTCKYMTCMQVDHIVNMKSVT